MKSLNRAIDRFCQKHRRFGIPKLMVYIVFISALVYIVQLIDPSQVFRNMIEFNADRIIRRFEIWRLVTWVFLSVSSGSAAGLIDFSIIFAALMLYFYFFVGTTLEREWGTPKFTVFYLSGVLLNIIFGFIMRYGFMAPVSLSSFYLNLSMFFAFAVMYPDFKLMLFFIIPIKIKWMALLNAALFLYAIVSGIIGGHVLFALLPIIALLNFIIICGEDLFGYLRPLKARVSPRTINYKRAARQARREQEGKAYRHKCAVCGKTDTDNPQMEFRYCSRCNGYHCFCLDHINNHEHFR